MLRKIISCAVMAAVVALASCTKDEWPDQPDWSQIPNPDEEIDDGLLKPAACDNNIVAHRGGAAECNAPDNSLASLQYAIDQGCYASECDIYWTGDDNVVVAHADGNCRINGMHPWEHSLADLRAAGARNRPRGRAGRGSRAPWQRSSSTSQRRSHTLRRSSSSCCSFL